MATTKTIELRTAVPGPRSREVLARKEAVVAEPLSLYLPLVIAEARGATLTDVDGNTFIDFTGGVGCMNVGHSHPRVVEAIREQAERFTHTDFTIVPYEGYVSLAERLAELAPVGGDVGAALFKGGGGAMADAGTRMPTCFWRFIIRSGTSLVASSTKVNGPGVNRFSVRYCALVTRA